MSHADESRLAMELELLAAMYPEQIDYNPRSRDLKFTDGSALLQLRLPEEYPETSFPDVILATDSSKNDVRDRVKMTIPSLGLEEGVEALDAFIACFQQINEANSTNDSPTATGTDPSTANACEDSKTVIIWLHHLLALGKRKLALSPPVSVSGITKPGYPGVMVFTGPLSAVNEHVSSLKAQNWQAFQVRYESGELWEFAHGAMVREVETMAEIAKAIELSLDGTRRKEEFLSAVGIK